MAPSRKKNSGPAISKTIIPRERPEHVTIDPILEKKLFDAYKAVTLQGQSIRKAAKIYGTSRTTLTKYLYGERKNKVVAHEYEMSLNVCHENELESYIKYLTQTSEYINKRAVYSLANELLELNPDESSKKKAKVSQSWISKFFKRHPQLSQVKPIVFQKPRVKDNYSIILNQWYAKLNEFFLTNNIQPSQIYNISEQCFSLEDKDNGKDFQHVKITYDCFKDHLSKPVSEDDEEEEEEEEEESENSMVSNTQNISTVETICADGTKLNTLFILHGKILEDLIVNHGSSMNNQALFNIFIDKNDDIIKDSEIGYTSGELSLRWLKRFNKLTKSKSLNQSRLLLMNYHTSHVSLEFLKYSISHNIVPILVSPFISKHILPINDILKEFLKDLTAQIKFKFDELKLNNSNFNSAEFLKVYNEINKNQFQANKIATSFKNYGIHPTVDTPSVTNLVDNHYEFKEVDFIDLNNSITSLPIDLKNSGITSLSFLESKISIESSSSSTSSVTSSKFSSLSSPSSTQSLSPPPSVTIDENVTAKTEDDDFQKFIYGLENDTKALKKSKEITKILDAFENNNLQNINNNEYMGSIKQEFGIYGDFFDTKELTSDIFNW